MPDKDLRRAIQIADKYARNKDYPCLFPGCKQKAIASHSIPRASCIEALADNGVLYTRRASLNRAITMTNPTDPPDIVPVGVNLAGVFKGYCPAHDASLFSSAETTNRHKKNGMFIALHLRALSVEYCRKRQILDFYRKMAELTSDTSLRSHLQLPGQQLDTFSSCFKEAYLGSVFNLISGSNVDSVDYYCVPFSRNLNVSSCGCFDESSGAFDSVIAYNLISYADMALLVLTTFKAVKQHLDSYIGAYSLPSNGERLIKDIAFLHCEEPLISARLWRSLTQDEQLEMRLFLRHPHFRTEATAPRIIKVSPSDYVTALTPAMLMRLAPQLDVGR